MATDDGPIGRYGTIHYMKRTEDVPLVSYPVDDETVTFGRSDDVVACHIRLYDLWASGKHCQLIFNDGKAFLRVYGQNGVTVDGTHYMPSKDELSPTTVPLTNDSEFLIYKRRFIFQYPPKELRAKLLATPRPKSRKSLRMSMIDSAQVWTPNPRAKPEENLAMLRSPIKALEDQRPITMLEGEPVYVQDDGEDLVVVEKVDAFPEPSPPKAPTSPRKPQTPSLHRAVLQRNAHRSLQKLNEVEEREVEEFVAPQALNFDSRVEEEEEGEEDEEDEEEKLQEEQKPSLPASPFSASVFRKSLSALGNILPFGSGSPERSAEASAEPANAEQADGQDSDEGSPDDETPEVNVSMHSEEATEEENEEGEDEDEDEDEAAPPSRPRQLTSFHTPQVPRTSAFKSHLRMSVGGKLAGGEDPSDLESARRHLEAMRKLPRPVLIRVPDGEDDDAPATSAAPMPVTPGRAKPKPRLSSILKPLPELGSSPTRQNTFSNRFTDDEDDWDPSTPKAKDIEAFNTGARFREVMRQVQDARRRESIREARRSFAPGELFGIGVASVVSEETKDQEMVGEDEPEDAPTPKPVLTSATHVSATPNYTGIPGLFRNPPPPPKTPSFQGITHLFSNPTIPAATPAYEGVKSIFASPPPPPPALETKAEAEDIEMVDVQEEGIVEVKEVKTPANKGRRGKKSTPATIQTQQEEVEELPVPKSTKRGRKAATPVVEPEEVQEPIPAVSKRRTRSQSVEPMEEVVAIVVSAPRSRRGRTPALEETEETVKATPVVSRASKRGKKPAVVVEEPPLEAIDEDIQMDDKPAESLEAGSSTELIRTAKVTVLEGEETPTAASVKRKTNARSARVPATVADPDARSDHIPEAETEAVNTPAPSKPRSRKAKALEDSVAQSSRLPRAARTLRTPLMESTTTIDEEQQVEADLVASTDKKTAGASRVKGVRSTTGGSGAKSKSSSAAASSSSARRAKGVDENTAPVVLEPASRVTRTRRRK